MFWKKNRSKQADELAAAKKGLGVIGGGVHKRIDENRELMELLHREAPEFMANHPWVNGWLMCHDEYFNAIAEKLAPEDPLFPKLNPKEHHRGFPRPVPEQVITRYRKYQSYCNQSVPVATYIGTTCTTTGLTLSEAMQQQLAKIRAGR